MSRCLDDAEFAASLVRQFLDQVNDRQESLRALWQAEQQEPLIQEVHRLKGTAATIGAEPLAELLARVESDVKAGQLESLPAAFQQMEHELVRLAEFAKSNF